MAPWRTILSDDVMFRVSRVRPKGCTNLSRLSNFIKERSISAFHRILLPAYALRGSGCYRNPCYYICVPELTLLVDLL
jgi:hypothetical protein